MRQGETIANEVGEFGFAIARDVVRQEMIDELIGLCSQATTGDQTRRRGESLYGIRNLLSAVPPLRDVMSSPPFIELARSVLGEAARPVKGVYFDKTPEANWLVPWHQDVTITVREHRDVAGYEMRPVRDGVVHALPPSPFPSRCSHFGFTSMTLVPTTARCESSPALIA